MSDVAAGALGNATVLIKAGMFDQAGEVLDQLVQEHPEATQPHLLRAMLAQAQNDKAAMATALEAVLTLDPNNLNASIGLVGLMDDVTLSEDLLAKLEPALGLAVASDHRALIGLGAVHVARDQMEAIPGLIETVPAEILAGLPYRGAVAAIAQRLDKQDHPEIALKMLLQVVERLPDAAGLEGVLGAMAFRADELDLAAHWLDIALKRDDSDSGIVFARATIMLRQREWQPLLDFVRPYEEQFADKAYLHELRTFAAVQTKDEELADEASSKLMMLEPESATSLTYRGLALGVMGEEQAALDKMREAIAVDPEFAMPWSHLAGMLMGLSEIGEAEEAARKAVELDPNNAIAQQQLGLCMRDLLRQDEGLSHLRLATELDPDNPTTWRAFLFSMNYAHEAEPADIAAGHKAFGEHLAKRNEAAAIMPAKPKTGPLRVGFVSGDLRRHSVGYFLMPLYRHFADHADRLEVVSFMTKDDTGDDVNKLLKSKSGEWHNIADADTAQTVETVRAANIDVLFDLSGHTIGDRLDAFAQRLAPVQINYLGYANTTGIPTMDGRITDAVADPVGQTEKWHSETLLRMPTCFLCYSPGPDGPDGEELPPPDSVDGRRIRFGCFNNLSKVTVQQVALWARILKSVPDSVFIFKSKQVSDPSVRERMGEVFKAEGLDPEQHIDWRSGTDSHKAHMSMYREVDIALDTFPYNGTTTTCEALFMGTPVVTLRGQHHVTRVSSTLLSAIGRDDLVADTADAYVARAVELAGDITAVRNGRAALRDQMLSSPLCDAELFTEQFVDCLTDFWRANC
ncbi:MAG: hypothetical protein KI792_14485 [Alphaproteobacteria bacterium]|nr:hypothetical protein [Alphaproteobacteria bacterium SS10]